MDPGERSAVTKVGKAKVRKTSWSRVGKFAAGVVVVLLVAYAYFASTYRNANWVFSPPQVLTYESRTYALAASEPTPELPDPRSGYRYTQLTRLQPFRQPIFGLEGVSGQMNLFLRWHGEFHRYGIVGGPP